jgi:glycerol-3-phosphate acyltransferase PlsY
MFSHGLYYMYMIYDIILIIGAYLFGSIPYMLLLSRAKGVDLSQETDLHIATWHKVGRLEGISGIIFDLLKGILPVLIGALLDFRLVIVVIAGIAALIGQMWPVFQRFDGEKGNTTGGGVVLTVSICYNAYLIVISGAFIMLIGFLVRTVPRFTAPGQTLNERMKFGGPVSNSLPLGMLLGFAAMPLAAWLLHSPLEITIAMIVIFVLIVIRRLTAGICNDLKIARTGTTRIFINRLLFDRSYL